MKKLFVFSLAFLLALSAFSKDEKTVKVSLIAHLNPSDLVELVPGSGWYIPASGTYTGTASHIGNLDQMNSYYELTDWVVGSTTVTQYVEGIMTGANGESLFFTGVSVFQRADHSGVVTVTVTG